MTPLAPLSVEDKALLEANDGLWMWLQNMRREQALMRDAFAMMREGAALLGEGKFDRGMARIRGAARLLDIDTTTH